MVFNTASILTLFIGLILGGTAIYAIIILTGAGAGKKAEKMINDAKKEAEKHRRDSIIELKEESFKLKQQTDKEIKEKKSEILSSEERLMQREKSLDKREEMLHNRDNLLEQKDNNLNILQKQLQEKELKMDELIREEIDKLEQISNLSKEKAHDLIMERVESAMAVEIASFIKDKEAEATLEVDKKAKNLLVNSMERYANDVTTIQTVSTIELPNDEMKGRLIGREGRNIRTIEAVTGVDLIIDDTPEVIVISSFDPFRREIAKVTIETLIKDGRIHPTRIEEIYDKVCRDMNTRVTEIGNETIYELGLSKIDPELVYLIGKLNFRTSYGQNALNHSKEVANLAGLLASEIGENINLAKRAGLLHDIGKSIDNEIEGSHIEIGVDLAKKYGENDIVQNAILSHHGDHEATNIISVLISIADTLSAARPGARNDTMENYIKRLEELENLGNSFDGVEKTYAMQAGREVRIIVKPDEIDDL
ncbi:MAG: ribonuclease Y, partial [Bacilli bacterium]|nr:ribonuclease Y [Bacilli bacterium]